MTMMMMMMMMMWSQLEEPHLNKRLWKHFCFEQLEHAVHDIFPAFSKDISMAMS